MLAHLVIVERAERIAAQDSGVIDQDIDRGIADVGLEPADRRAIGKIDRVVATAGSKVSELIAEESDHKFLTMSEEQKVDSKLANDALNVV